MNAHEWGTMTSQEFKALEPLPAVAILPIGAIEQHGPHLPLDTDNIAAEQFARMISAQTDTLLLPCMPYGQVWSLKKFPGSLTISNRTLIAFLCDLCNSLKLQGMRGLVVVSGHLGNMPALKEAAREILEEIQFPVMTLFYPGLKEAAEPLLEGRIDHPSIVHADEIETSILLSLKPEVVRTELAVDEYSVFPPDFEYVPAYWDGMNESGVFGSATKASKQKGDAVIEQVLEKSIRLVQYFIHKLT